jgi:hypothetical protein
VIATNRVTFDAIAGNLLDRGEFRRSGPSF